MTITKSKEMIIDEKQFDSDASQNRKPDGKLFSIFFSFFLFKNTYNILCYIRYSMRVDADADKKASIGNVLQHGKRKEKSSTLLLNVFYGQWPRIHIG